MPFHILTLLYSFNESNLVDKHQMQWLRHHNRPRINRKIVQVSRYATIHKYFYIIVYAQCAYTALSFILV